MPFDNLGLNTMLVMIRNVSMPHSVQSPNGTQPSSADDSCTQAWCRSGAHQEKLSCGHEEGRMSWSVPLSDEQVELIDKYSLPFTKEVMTLSDREKAAEEVAKGFMEMVKVKVKQDP